jgi:MFS family permease
MIPTQAETDKKVNQKVLLAGILAFSFYSTAHMQIAAPVIGILSQDIGETNVTLLGMITTLPSLAFIPANLLFGKLSMTVNKKTLWLIGTILWIVGGGLTPLFHSIVPILVCRALLGVGTGFCIPLVTAIVPDYYEGAKAGAMIGVNTGVAGLWGFLLANASGMLAGYGWRASFMLHFVAFAVLAVGMACVPKKPLVSGPPQDGNAPKEKQRLGMTVYVNAVLIGVLMLPILAFWAFSSVYISEEGLGTTAQAGLAISLLTLFSSVAALLTGKIMSITKRFTLFAGCLMLALGFISLVYAQNYAMVIIGVALIGGCQGLLVPYMLIVAAMSSGLEMQALAQSVILIGVFLGQFLASPWFAAINAVFHATGVRDVLAVNLWFCVIIAIVVLAAALVGKKKRAA